MVTTLMELSDHHKLEKYCYIFEIFLSISIKVLSYYFITTQLKKSMLKIITLITYKF